ncbi:MAG: aminotransferase class V-fold PLP-dependent enzyme [Mangrovicoccus sp.]|nr:aminotransferase class V-fold PLP-dependent enzyme [Mangrovicoccus sp.]
MLKAPKSLAQGRHYLAIPGPSVMPDRVLQAMHQPAPNIYKGGLVDMVETLLPDLKAVARTKHHLAIYIANGHGAWEAALSNVLSPGDQVLVLSTGRFAHGWGDMAAKFGAQVEILEFGPDRPADPARFAEALAADHAHKIKAVLAVQVDTSTSVRSDIAALRAAMDDLGHPALFMVDCIACLACDAFEMDAWGVDVMVTGSQKGLMTPPGLGFVFFNDRADAARDRAECVTGYWDWRPRSRPEMFYQYFGGTAPTHHLFALREALTMLVHEEGLEQAWARHGALARAVWAAFEAWGQGGALRLNVPDPAHRSHAVTTLRIAQSDSDRIQDWVTAQAGLTLGIGLGLDGAGGTDGAFRLGHMGYVNAQMVLGALGAIETALIALDIPHGAGGLSAAAQILAQQG